MGHESFLKIVYEGTTDFTNKNIETIWKHFGNFAYFIFKENKHIYLCNLLPTKKLDYNTRNTDKITLFHTKHNFFKNCFFPSTVIEWNKLDFNF